MSGYINSSVSILSPRKSDLQNDTKKNMSEQKLTDKSFLKPTFANRMKNKSLAVNLAHNDSDSVVEAALTPHKTYIFRGKNQSVQLGSELDVFQSQSS